jgi:N utilization substance protein A
LSGRLTIVPASNAIDLSGVLAELRANGIDPAQISQLLCQAVVDSYRQNVDADLTVRAELDFRDGSLRLLRGYGRDQEDIELPGGEAARQTVRAARKVVANYLTEQKIESVVRTAEARRNSIVDGIVEGVQGKVWMLRLVGDTWGLLPPEEQTRNERLERGAHLKVVVLGGRRRSKDAVFVVSRTHPLLVQRLLEREVPELMKGEIEIREIARDPGKRSKVAVFSNVEAIDARGACIGPKGVRHRAVTAELGDEQLQIVNWSEDPAQFVANALAPAEAISVSLDQETHTANVVVAADKLSLAIGKSGENARLVARLTGWRIDIKSPEAG